MAETEEKTVQLNDQEEHEADRRTRLTAPVIYEIIRHDGEAELVRPALSLCLSGFAAGLAIGFSVLGKAILQAYLPDDVPYRHLIDSWGYTFGFIIVILSRLQLFTENTITVVLPALLNPTLHMFARTGRLWGIVLAANVVGCAAMAMGLLTPGAVAPEVKAAALDIGRHLMGYSPWEMFIKGIFAGWLIAALVWLMPSAEGAGRFWSVAIMTYIIAAGDFTHIVAGSVEAFMLVLSGEVALTTMLTGFFLPTLAGNITGGTVLFAMLSYGQIAREV